MISKIEKYINKATNIVAITGAGISTSSGIPDFRGPNGLYSRSDIAVDKLFDINYFKYDPGFFYNNIGNFWQECCNAHPTAGHIFLKELEDTGKLKTVITQNIDGLHHKAGSKKVIPIHGDFNNFYCTSCYKNYPADNKIFNQVINKKIPFCPECQGILKPAIIFYGEPVPLVEEAINYIKQTDLLLIIGSSLLVYPVAGLPGYLPSDSKIIIINMDKTPLDHRADIIVNADIDESVKMIDL